MHRARLHTGEQVVVIVQRPGIAAVVARDLDIVERIAARLERSTRWAKSIGTVSLASGFATAIRAELDFTIEAGNLAAVSASQAKSDRVRIPSIHLPLLTLRVLVMEQLDGTGLSAATNYLPPERRQELAQSLLTHRLRQILVDGVFPCRPASGNVLLLTDGSLGLVDFGSVGRLDGTIRSGVRRHAARADPARRSGRAGSAAAIGQLQARSPTSYSQSGSTMVGDLLRIVARHGLGAPAEVAAVFRSLVTLDATLAQLAPGFDLVSHSRELGRSPGARADPSIGRRPTVTEAVSLHHLLGYHLLAVSAILGLRAMVPLFRQSEELNRHLPGWCTASSRGRGGLGQTAVVRHENGKLPANGQRAG